MFVVSLVGFIVSKPAERFVRFCERAGRWIARKLGLGGPRSGSSRPTDTPCPYQDPAPCSYGAATGRWFHPGESR
jgi:hypothetical protein